MLHCLCVNKPNILSLRFSIVNGKMKRNSWRKYKAVKVERWEFIEGFGISPWKFDSFRVNFLARIRTPRLCLLRGCRLLPVIFLVARCGPSCRLRGLYSVENGKLLEWWSEHNSCRQIFQFANLWYLEDLDLGQHLLKTRLQNTATGSQLSKWVRKVTAKNERNIGVDPT